MHLFWPLVPSTWLETEHLVLQLLMLTTVTKNKADEQSDCGGNKEINSCDLSLRPVSVRSWWLLFVDMLCVQSLKVYFLTKVQTCTSWMILALSMYLLPLIPVLNACPLTPCSIGHKDFFMLFRFQSRLSLKCLSSKLFLPPHGVAFSKGIAAPPSSLLCPWVTSPADVYEIITSIQLPLKYLSAADLPHISFTSHCLPSASSWQTACYQAPWDPKKQLIKKQTQQHSFP